MANSLDALCIAVVSGKDSLIAEGCRSVGVVQDARCSSVRIREGSMPSHMLILHFVLLLCPRVFVPVHFWP